MADVHGITMVNAYNVLFFLKLNLTSCDQMNLLIETKIIIANFDQEAWIKLAIYDEEFRNYAYTKVGRKQFIDLFTVMDINVTLITYILFGKLHRDDGPAMISSIGTQGWFQNGKTHREDGPAIIWSEGIQHWYQNGTIHRDDGPAIVWSDGKRCWYQHGKLHRDDGPAVLWPCGLQQWYQHGKLHIDGTHLP